VVVRLLWNGALELTAHFEDLFPKPRLGRQLPISFSRFGDRQLGPTKLVQFADVDQAFVNVGG
jgi:hypothetical protein